MQDDLGQLVPEKHSLTYVMSLWLLYNISSSLFFPFSTVQSIFLAYLSCLTTFLYNLCPRCIWSSTRSYTSHFTINAPFIQPLRPSDSSNNTQLSTVITLLKRGEREVKGCAVLTITLKCPENKERQKQSTLITRIVCITK